MKLTKIALQLIDKPETRLKLALALGFTEAWIITLISKNEENNKLTLAVALEVIRKETGLTDLEILEPVAAESLNRVA